MLLFHDVDLIKYFIKIGKPLPFSISTLRKDRLDGRLGVPFRRIGQAIYYSFDDVLRFLQGTPVVIPKRNAVFDKKPILKRGKPTNSERVEAERMGISVPELRAKKGVV